MIVILNILLTNLINSQFWFNKSRNVKLDPR